jgi:nitronate monooxygenase
MFKTRFTEMLGVQYPIQCGTMMYVSNAEFVAANANAGIFTCLASAMCTSESDLVDEIRKVKDLTDRPFGVNISLFPGLLPIAVERTIEVVARQGVRIIETAGRNPEPYRGQIRDSGLIHLHKCARARDAVKAEALGVDMVAVVGTECGGHPSMEDVTSMVLIPAVAERIRIPLVAGGGFCDGRTLVAALALGADAMLAGTRFLNTTECRIHPKTKDALLKAKETDTVVIQRSIGSATRVLRNEWAERVLDMEREGAALEDLMPLISGKRAGRAWISGEEDAVLACGQVVGRIHEIVSIKELVTKIMSEAEETKKRIMAS